MFPSLNISEAAGKPKKLLDQVRDLMRLRHYSIRTERCYCDWITRFIRFHGNICRNRNPTLGPILVTYAAVIGS
jgi:hypothetical protein